MNHGDWYDGGWEGAQWAGCEVLWPGIDEWLACWADGSSL